MAQHGKARAADDARSDTLLDKLAQHAISGDDPLLPENRFGDPGFRAQS